MNQFVEKSKELFVSIRQTTSSVNAPQRVEQPKDSSNPEQHVWPCYENALSGMRSGVWQSQAGSWKVEIKGYTEFCVLKEGEVVVQEENGTRHELKAGDALVMEDGFRGVWTVNKYARKYYFISNTTSS